jgi:hypothetical protein
MNEPQRRDPFYYHQRIRHEGYDIEMLTAAAGMNARVTLPGKHRAAAPGVEGVQS